MSAEWLIRAGDQQRIAWLGGSEHRVLLDGAATHDRLTAFRSTMRAGAASPVHVHEHDDETIFMLGGSAVCWVGEQRWNLEGGDSVFLPRHVPHSYLFTADSEILTVCNPAGTEDFFRAVGWDLKEPMPDGWTVDPATLRAAGEARGQHVLGPPLGAGDSMPSNYLTEQ